MKLHNGGKFKDESQLPTKEVEGSIPFKEPKDIKTLGIIGNILAIFIMAIFAAIVWIFKREEILVHMGDSEVLTGCLLSLVVLIPHEFLHAICFKEDVYYFHALDKGVLFVTGTEDMSKFHFIFMSMLPAMVLGFIPYILYFFMPDHIGLAVFGILGIGGAAGDYINVFNCITQVPSGYKVYMSGQHSYYHE